MADAYIYDAVRTPRGKGKPDGALHEATALHLATTVLKAVRDRNELDTALVDDVVLGVVSPVKEQGSDIGPRGRHQRRLRRDGGRRADQPLLRLGAGGHQHGGCAGDGGPIGLRHRRRRGEHVAGGDGLRRRRLGERSVRGVQELFRAAGHRRRHDRHQVGLLARGRRRLRGGEPEARGGRLEGRPLQEVGGAGEGPDRPHAARSRRAHAARHHHAVAGQPEAVVRAAGRELRVRCGGEPALPGGRAHRARAPRRQLVGHRRRRRRHPDRQQGGGPEGRAQAARAHPRLHLHRLGAVHHADGAREGDAQGAEARRHEARATSTSTS